MTHRITAIKNFLKKNELDAVLISSPTMITYLSSFSGFSSIERDGFIIVTNTDSYILTSALYAEAVKKEIAHLLLMEYTATISLSTLFQNISKKHSLKRIGFESDNLTVSEWNMFKKNTQSTLIPISLNQLRISKETREITEIKNASIIADQAFKKVLPHIVPGMTEKQLVSLLENEIRKDASSIAFPTIVAFGKNAAVPHHKSNDTKLKKHDLVLIDFGAVSHEYRSDMTRTFFIGEIPENQRKAWTAVYSAQQKAVLYITEQLNKHKPLPAQTVDRVAREFLIDNGFPSIPHSLGHGIGLDVHEAPSISPRSEELLTDGMVFSIEPGVYIPDAYGIRIEDLYVIKNGSLTQLTPPCKTLLQI